MILTADSLYRSAFRVERAGFTTEVDFSNYRNKNEQELVDDTNVNWIRTDARNAYVCQGTQIKRDAHLLRLLPAGGGQFMITYIYARPKVSVSKLCETNFKLFSQIPRSKLMPLP